MTRYAASAASRSRPGKWSTTCSIGVGGRAPVTFIGGVSTDQSGFGVGRMLDVEVIADRILALHEDREMPLVPGYDVAGYQLQEHQKS